MSKTQEEQKNSGSSRRALITLIISIIAIVISGFVGWVMTRQIKIVDKQADISEELNKLTREQFEFFRRERTIPLQGKTLACFHNLSTYFKQIKTFPKAPEVPPLETNGEQYFSPSAIVLEFSEKPKEAEEADMMFLLDEDTRHSEEMKVVNEFLRKIANQENQDRAVKLFAESGHLKYTFLIEIFNSREVKVDVTEISCDRSKWIQYLKKKKGEEYKDWRHLTRPTPNSYFPPRIYSFDNNEWKVCNIPIEINSKTRKYILVVFDSIWGNVLETVKSELEEESKFMRLNQTLLNYLNSFRGVEIVICYEDKKLILPPSPTVPKRKSMIFEEGFPYYRFWTEFMTWEAGESFDN